MSKALRAHRQESIVILEGSVRIATLIFGVLVVTFVAAAIGSGWERGLVIAAAAALVAALFDSPRPVATRFAGVLLSACVAALAMHFLLDHFDYHLVWLYSAPSLPAYLKLANLWGGDEGTLLLLAWLLTLFAARWSRRDPWTSRGAIGAALFFLVAAAVWNPFAQTPPEALAGAVSQGANAHLLTPWMALHPPLVLAGYALLIAPLGAILGAIAGARTDWPELSAHIVRAAWWLISCGIAVGMWWAYEDLTFGQFWHWDPVQTSLFIVWALLSAQLHTQRPYQLTQGGCFSRWQPQLAGWSAASALLAMTVTRSPLLASSHRYVGETSMPWLALGVIAVSVALVLAPWFGERRVPRARSPANTVVWIGIALLVGAAAVALVHLGQAVVAELNGWSRDNALRPFFETLVRWADAAEVARLRAAFSQWEVNPFAVNRWMLPVAVFGMLLLGHLFLPLRRLGKRRAVTLLVGVGGAVVALLVQPLTRFYDGTGMTSQQTTVLFPWIDLLLLYALYALTALLCFAGAAVLRGSGGGSGLTGGAFPVGLLHAGVVLMLVALLSATVFDSYGQRLVDLPDQYGVPLAFPDGYRVTIEEPRTVDEGDEGFHAVARVKWGLQRGGEQLETSAGETLYRDTRSEGGEVRGSVRQLCELLDYRYARFSVGPQRQLRPFIHRGVWRDVQLWLAYPSVRSSGGKLQMAEGSVPAVLKVYPLASWVWVGVVITLGATLLRWRGIALIAKEKPL